MSNTSLFRLIPKMDALLAAPCIAQLEGEVPHALVMEQLRLLLEELRREIRLGERETVPTAEELAREGAARIRGSLRKHLRRVINGTGVVLHTNLGRARLCPQAVKAVAEAAGSYSNLEYDLEEGKRGSRYDHVEELLCRLTGAEAAMVVNNNAASVMLILGAMTRGREVVISRGELVEIGGSFRVPEIMEQSGSILREVGATNKTHLRDYENAIDPERTAALLKVHTSNYRIIGFTESVSVPELAELGRSHHIPLIYDMGSGAMLDFGAHQLMEEPTVAQCVRDGADVVCFSGDKLLGGPQAGIIVGKREYIEQMKKHPLTRAFRVDKMSLAALEATLSLYRDPERAMEEIPTVKMLLEPTEELRQKAEELKACLRAKLPALSVTLEESLGQVGGGSMPGQLLPGWSVALECPESCPAEELEQRLRRCDPAVVGRIAHSRFLLDVRTMERDEFEPAAEAAALCLSR